MIKPHRCWRNTYFWEEFFWTQVSPKFEEINLETKEQEHAFFSVEIVEFGKNKGEGEKGRREEGGEERGRGKRERKEGEGRGEREREEGEERGRGRGKRERREGRRTGRRGRGRNRERTKLTSLFSQTNVGLG
jgi:hypothetical protein